GFRTALRGFRTALRGFRTARAGYRTARAGYRTARLLLQDRDVVDVDVEASVVRGPSPQVELPRALAIERLALIALVELRERDFDLVPFPVARIFEEALQRDGRAGLFAVAAAQRHGDRRGGRGGVGIGDYDPE